MKIFRNIPPDKIKLLKKLNGNSSKEKYLLTNMNSSGSKNIVIRNIGKKSDLNNLNLIVFIIFQYYPNMPPVSIK